MEIEIAMVESAEQAVGKIRGYVRLRAHLDLIQAILREPQAEFRMVPRASADAS